MKFEVCAEGQMYGVKCMFPIASCEFAFVAHCEIEFVCIFAVAFFSIANYVFIMKL